jgi:predicted alpha/beta superfamily hydrolase
MTPRSLRAALLVLALTGLGAKPTATEAGPITLGQSYRLHADALGDERTLNVYLPADYATEPKKTYPVLYLIDGGIDQDFVHIVGASQLGATWGRSQDAIVVGIASQDRRRELVGPTADPALLAQYPTAGHSADFRRFLREQVKPFVASRFRTNGQDGVIGESLAGLFIVETYLREPDLFGAYAAVSPSLWWDHEALSRQAASLVGPRQAGRRLYLTTANEGPEMQPPVDRLVAALARAQGWCYAPREDLTHSTIYHSVAPTALEYLFPPATAPDPEFGFVIRCAKSGAK